MPDISVCVEIVFDDEPFHERVPRAAAAGADVVEFWDWRDKDLDALQAAADEADVPVAAFGAGGTLTDPDQADEAVETIRESIETASDLGCPTLIATTGPDVDGLDRETQYENVVEVLSTVAPDAEEAGVTLALEPLNTAVDRIGHVHVADVPGRHEPGTGELNYANVFSALDDAGYDGYVGCEFRPTGDPESAMDAVLDCR